MQTRAQAAGLTRMPTPRSEAPGPSAGDPGGSAMPGVARRRLVVVDAHGHAFRAFWALEPMYAPDGLPTNALFGLAGLLERVVQEDRPDYVAIVFDAPDDTRRTFRSALYPAYKAHRPERPAELARQIPVLREVARAFGLVTLEHPDFEADDLVATVVALAEAAEVQTTILSADKDLLQLVSDRTLVWDAMRGKRYTHAAVEDKLGVPPALVADYLALVGDSSDNVPGVPGIGPKGASALLRTFGGLEAIYRSIEAVPPRERKKLEEHRERAFLSRALTVLRTDVPFEGGLERLARPNGFAEDAASLWERLGFRGLARRALAAEGRGRAQPRPVMSPASPEPPTAPPPVEIQDLEALGALVRAARSELALGLALAPTEGGGSDPTRVGVALPSGSTWRVVLADARRRPVQGTLFAAPEARSALAAADLAAALDSLLSDPRRVVCVCGEASAAGLLGTRPGHVCVELDAPLRRDTDPATLALEALSSWLEAAAPRAPGGLP